MESFKQKLEEEKIFSAIKKEREAKVSEQEREKFGGDYSINPENIKIFTNVVLDKIAEKLPENFNAADLGGAGGRLAESVKNELEKKGKHSQFTVVDNNKGFVKEAEKRDLKTIEANLANDIPLKEIDLMIMRNVLHYNSLQDIKKILTNVKSSLKDGGFFVNQVISAKNQDYVHFINEILSSKVLGRGVNYLTNEEYLKLCNETELPTDLAGYALPGRWTLKEMFWRTYPKKSEAKGVEDMSVFTDEEKEEYYKKRDAYVERCREILEKYSKEEKIDDIEFNGAETEVEFYGPIFISHI